MLPKTHLTSHSRMAGSRWVITPSWLSELWRYVFVQFFCVFLPLLNIFFFCYVHTISVLYWTHLCIKCSLGISQFLEEISTLSHSTVFLYFFALITGKGFLMSTCCSLELCIQMGTFFLSSFAFLLFTAICKASSDSHFTFFHVFFLRMVLIPVSCTMSRTSIHSSSGVLSIRSSPLNLFLTSTV